MQKTLVYSKSARHNTGGAETLVIRIMQWCHSNGFVRFIVILPPYGIRKPAFIDEIRQMGIELEIYFDDSKNEVTMPISTSGCYLKFNGNETVLWFSEMLDTYLKGEYIKNKSCRNTVFYSFLYIIHPDFLKMVFRKKLLKRIFYYICIFPIIKNNLIFMDLDTIYESEKFYKKSFKNAMLLRLPITFDKTFSDCEAAVKKRICNDKFSILTVTRMDFPHKGYVFGLIKEFSELKKIYENIELIIIGDGAPQTSLVEGAIQKSGVKDSIKLLGPVQYGKLYEYISKADVYVGQGTSVLDAAKAGTICIPVDSYENELMALGNFSDVPEIGAINHLLPVSDFKELFKRVYESTDAEYFECCRKTYEICRKHYNIEEFMKKLTQLQHLQKKSCFGNERLCWIEVLKGLDMILPDK